MRAGNQYARESRFVADCREQRERAEARVIRAQIESSPQLLESLDALPDPGLQARDLRDLDEPTKQLLEASAKVLEDLQRSEREQAAQREADDLAGRIADAVADRLDQFMSSGVH